jgi:hypothetical protein
VLAGQQFQRQRAADARGDISMNRENVRERPLVCFGPHFGLIHHVDESCRNSNLPGRSADAAFHDVLRPKLTTNLVHSLARTLVTHRRGPGDHGQAVRTNTSEVGNQLLGQAIAEVILLRIGAQVDERQNCEPDAFAR